MSESGSREQWWLSTSGAVEGPYSGAFLQAGLKSGVIPGAAHACRVRGETWKPLSEWDEFRDSVPRADAEWNPRTHSNTSLPSPLTNPRLPAMANWICIYCIAIAPIWCLISRLSCFVTGATFRETSTYFAWDVIEFLVGGVISLVATTLLLLGGLRLRTLDRSGPVLILTAIWFALVAGLLLFTVSMTLLAVSSPEDVAESTTAGLILGFLFGSIGLVELVFLIASLVWLHRNNHSLPLVDA